MEHKRIILLFVACIVSLMFSGCKDNEGEIKIVGGGGIVLYSSDASFDGNLGGPARGPIDSICVSSSNKPEGYNNIHALISIDAADDIFDMTGNWGVPNYAEIRSPNGNFIFSDWGDLTDGSDLTVTFVDVGILPPGAEWWSGSDFRGNGLGNNCSTWTSNSGGMSGSYGKGYDLLNPNWIDEASNQWCNNLRFVVCVAY